MFTKSARTLVSASLRRLNSTLAFVETTGSSITPASLATLTAAKQIGNPITALLVGSEAGAAAESLKKSADVSKILVSKNSKLDHFLPEELSALVADVVKGDSEITHVLTPASAVGKNFLPRVGALLDLQPVSDIIKVEAKDTFVRPIYAGNALATVKSKDKVVLVSVRGSSFPPAVLSGGDAPVEEVALPESGNRTEFVSEELVTSERPDLGSAVRVVSGGRGLKSKEQFAELIEPLATSLNAAIGASRAAVDAGFCDNSLQVGQTGKVVAPDLYVAVGISGAIQHLAGMKDSKTIVAINKDEEAPIFNVADVGLVGDLFEIVPELTKKIESTK